MFRTSKLKSINMKLKYSNLSKLYNKSKKPCFQSYYKTDRNQKYRILKTLNPDRNQLKKLSDALKIKIIAK